MDQTQKTLVYAVFAGVIALYVMAYLGMVDAV